LCCTILRDKLVCLKTKELWC